MGKMFTKLEEIFIKFKYCYFKQLFIRLSCFKNFFRWGATIMEGTLIRRNMVWNHTMRWNFFCILGQTAVNPYPATLKYLMGIKPDFN